MEMALCVASGAVVGAAMVASQEASRRRREAFMRKGDEVLQDLFRNPQELAELKRISRLPDEAVVWFVIVHVGGLRLKSEFSGKSVKLNVKHGGQGWSVVRETTPALAQRTTIRERPAMSPGPPGSAPRHLQASPTDAAAASAAARARGTAATNPATAAAAAARATAATNGLRPRSGTASSVTSDEDDMDQFGLPRHGAADSPVSHLTQDCAAAEMNSVLLFMWSTGLLPLLRFRLQYFRPHRKTWATAGFAELPLSAEAGRISFEELEIPLFDNKLASRGLKRGGVIGAASVVVETRGMFVSDLKQGGLAIGTVVPSPLPGQDATPLLVGIPVESGISGNHPNVVGGGHLRRREFQGRLLQRPRTAEASDSSDGELVSATSSEEEYGSSSAASSDDGSECSRGKAPTLGRFLRCQCR